MQSENHPNVSGGKFSPICTFFGPLPARTAENCVVLFVMNRRSSGVNNQLYLSFKSVESSSHEIEIGIRTFRKLLLASTIELAYEKL